MNLKEWMADLGAAAEELGYGIAQVTPNEIELVARQQDLRIVIESHFLSGSLLRDRLIKIEHRSGSSYSAQFERLTR